MRSSYSQTKQKKQSRRAASVVRDRSLGLESVLKLKKPERPQSGAQDCIVLFQRGLCDSCRKLSFFLSFFLYDQILDLILDLILDQILDLILF